MAGPAPVALSSGFWTLTFWGIAGTISGIIGTLVGLFGLWISYCAFIYKKPSIKIEINKLSYSKKFMDAAEAIDKAQREESVILNALYRSDNPYLVFTLSLNINNKTGGDGSIQKPRLIIRDLNRKDIGSLDPETSRLYSTGIKNLGENYHLMGGERKDNEYLRYGANNSQNRLMKGKFHFRYYLAYRDNSGKYNEQEIDSSKIKAE